MLLSEGHSTAPKALCRLALTESLGALRLKHVWDYLCLCIECTQGSEMGIFLLPQIPRKWTHVKSWDLLAPCTDFVQISNLAQLPVS